MIKYDLVVSCVLEYRDKWFIFKSNHSSTIGENYIEFFFSQSNSRITEM